MLWLIEGSPPPKELISLSNLMLDLKFALFLRVFKYFGKYFAIIIGVAKKIFSFLVILFIIIISFSHAFYIILKPRHGLDSPDLEDPNNPWSLTIRYYTYLTSNNSISSNSPYLVQGPDNNTNMFMGFKSSIFAIYKFLTGNQFFLNKYLHY